MSDMVCVVTYLNKRGQKITKNIIGHRNIIQKLYNYRRTLRDFPLWFYWEESSKALREYKKKYPNVAQFDRHLDELEKASKREFIENLPDSFNDWSHKDNKILEIRRY